MFQYYNNDEVSGERCNYEARIGVRWIRNDIFVWCIKFHGDI